MRRLESLSLVGIFAIVIVFGFTRSAWFKGWRRSTMASSWSSLGHAIVAGENTYYSSFGKHSSDMTELGLPASGARIIFVREELGGLASRLREDQMPFEDGRAFRAVVVVDAQGSEVVYVITDADRVEVVGL